MINILKNGKEMTYTVDCDKCDCLFSFNKIDIQEEYDIDAMINFMFTSNEDEFSHKQYVVCPQCGNKVYFED